MGSCRDRWNNFFLSRRWIFPFFQILFGLIWLSDLARTDAYFSVYVLIAFCSFFLIISNFNQERSISLKSRILLIVLSFLFSVAVLLANYPLYTTIGDPAVISRATSILMNLIDCVFDFIGGACVSFPIFKCFFTAFPIRNRSTFYIKYEKLLPYFIFLSLALLHLTHLFLVEYPGNLTEDSFSQISEMVTGQYSNYNTFWHTIFLRSILSVGYFLFSDFNAAVAFYCTVQTLIMTFAFTHCLMTMRLYGVPFWMICLSWLVYGLLPYHMALSITIWKDVLFAGGGLLLISALFRILNGLCDRKWWNHAVFLLGSLLFIISRTNGWLIYFVLLFVLAFFCHDNRGLLITAGTMAILGWFLLNPMLSFLHVGEGDLVESLSIPVQQVSRVIAEGHDLTDEEQLLLERVVDLEEVPQLYTQWLSDPMKIALRSKDYDYFLEHFSEYRDLWIRMGLRHPASYVKAWVEQTKGYWNAGYPYGMYSETITDNSYGIEKSGVNPVVAALFRLYFGLSRHLIFFEPLHSIGLHVWVLILCFLLNLAGKRRQAILCVPYLVLVAGLWFGTPVYACFRYVYPLFAAFPLLLSTTIWDPRKDGVS